eukprot:gnl/Chilomastix_cuspidata/6543.p4 GENE.gnl/Chilomastix_cuspidata/6543~~gnl/Chilomastix_cuspidata/6543.p4  ORF type:complete len:122 (+),score=20.57 gnl/Chilomastix_cuspidata/6543:391-756(+)
MCARLFSIASTASPVAAEGVCGAAATLGGAEQVSVDCVSASHIVCVHLLTCSDRGDGAVRGFWPLLPPGGPSAQEGAGLSLAKYPPFRRRVRPAGAVAPTLTGARMGKHPRKTSLGVGATA